MQMKIIISVLFLSVSLLATSCSGNTYTHPSVKEEQVADDLHITSIQEDQSLKLFIEDSTGNKIDLDTIEIPNDVPELDYAFTHSINGQPHIIAGISYDEDYRDFDQPYINWHRQYTVLIYPCDSNYHCTYNSKLSNFFGSGGDLVNYDTNEVLSTYLYKNQSIVKKGLESDLFRNWLNDNQTNGYAINTTTVTYSLLLDEKHTDYLSVGTKFLVTDASSGWLEITYNKDDQELQGYIKCEDTNLCS